MLPPPQAGMKRPNMGSRKLDASTTVSSSFETASMRAAAYTEDATTVPQPDPKRKTLSERAGEYHGTRPMAATATPAPRANIKGTSIASLSSNVSCRFRPPTLAAFLPLPDRATRPRYKDMPRNTRQKCVAASAFWNCWRLCSSTSCIPGAQCLLSLEAWPYSCHSVHHGRTGLPSSDSRFRRFCELFCTHGTRSARTIVAAQFVRTIEAGGGRFAECPGRRRCHDHDHVYCRAARFPPALHLLSAI